MIKLSDGKSYETVAIYGDGKLTYQGTERSTLRILFADSVAFDDIRALYTDTSPFAEIEIYEDEVLQSVLLNYTMAVKLEVNNDGVYLTLAQKSDIELEMENTQMALIEIAQMISEV